MRTNLLPNVIAVLYCLLCLKLDGGFDNKYFCEKKCAQRCIYKIRAKKKPFRKFKVLDVSTLMERKVEKVDINACFRDECLLKKDGQKIRRRVWTWLPAKKPSLYCIIGCGNLNWLDQNQIFVGKFKSKFHFHFNFNFFLFVKSDFVTFYHAILQFVYGIPWYTTGYKYKYYIIPSTCYPYCIDLPVVNITCLIHYK